MPIVWIARRSTGSLDPERDGGGEFSGISGLALPGQFCEEVGDLVESVRFGRLDDL
jgi:hypothetical protein